MNVLDSSGLIDILYQWLGGLGGSVIFILTVCLITSFLVAELFHRLKLPRIVGQIVAGIILGFPLWRDLLFAGDIVGYISILSELGIIFLLLLAGLEIDYVKLRKASKDIALVAVFSAVVPFILGFMVMKFLGYGDIPALILGAALSITAEGTKTAVLTEFNVLKTRLGAIMLGAGALDDIFEVIFIAAVVVLAHGSGILEI
ncbi:MAG: cation:proton antiporter, partial [Candidatus Altiarchaeales archaeon]|nr:cation:proton antiporter [Candidatus Altiarchaeales archaeon]